MTEAHVQNAPPAVGEFADLARNFTCPAYGSTDRFTINATCPATIDNNGSIDVRNGEGTVQLGDDDLCVCDACGNDASIADFCKST